ncbi:hypothetical protein EDC01DRAFT_642531 [Geopyxis carbonaria]|nr:hypothetical protein EDC01DRAFT_642531 [Geopyxis carbonaria]
MTSPTATKSHKARLIEEILSSPPHAHHAVLGAPRSATPAELRRCYLDRSKIIHPDKPPFHAASTTAFQRLSHSYSTLTAPSPSPPFAHPSPIASETTFRAAVSSILQEFLHGDFQLVRRLLSALARQYPSIVTADAINSIEHAFTRLRELALTTQCYALLLAIELGRLHRVQKRVRALRYLDVVGRVSGTLQLVKVTLAIPVRVDRALKEREKRRRGAPAGGVLLNESVAKVLEFIVGQEVEDMPEDGERRQQYWGSGERRAAAA